MYNEVTNIDQVVREKLSALTVNTRIFEQGAGTKELVTALRRGSKSKDPKNPGKPEFCFISGEEEKHLVVVEDKYGAENLVKLDDEEKIITTYPERATFALNGAVHYAKHVLENSSYFPSIFAIGVAGDGHHLEAEVFHVSNDGIKKLKPTEDFREFGNDAIDEVYKVQVLGELPQEEKDILALRRVANSLHEDMRNYASLTSDAKPRVVSAILLALKNQDFSIAQLRAKQGDRQTDGWRIWTAARDFLTDAYIEADDAEAKRGNVLDDFAFIRSSAALNTPQKQLGNVTPLRSFAATLENEVLAHINADNPFDVLGAFYGEFVKYGDSDGSDLGIVLTPVHITKLMTELIDVRRDDYVLDPCAGTASFLIAAMSRMISQAKGDKKKVEQIKSDQLHGIELQQKYYSLGVTNMILRGDGKAHFHCADMFSLPEDELRTSVITNGDRSTNVVEHGFTKALMNPPYSQAKNKEVYHLAELEFVYRALDLLNVGGKLAVIVPQSCMTNKAPNKAIKRRIMKNHTLDAVITLNAQTFHPVATNPVIAVFTAGIPHPAKKRVSLVDYREDGMELRPHIGLVNDGSHRFKREYLLSVLKGDEDESEKYIIRTPLKSEDEWLHAFFYFDDSPLEPEELDEVLADYLSFKFSMILRGRDYLFAEDGLGLFVKEAAPRPNEPMTWEAFELNEVATIEGNSRLEVSKHTPGKKPFVSSTALNNGVTAFVGNDHPSIRKNVLGVNYNGSVAKAFYHPYEAVFTDDVKAVTLKEIEEADRFTLLYLAAAIEKQRPKYMYGYKFNAFRMQRQKISLPVTEAGAPDWDYMRSFIKYEMQRRLQAMLFPTESAEEALAHDGTGRGAIDFRAGKVEVSVPHIAH